jgi:adenylate kinase
LALHLILFGPPGAGKGTQAEQIARSRAIPKISTGDILREAVQNGTGIGERAKAIMSQGQLVGDDLMIGIIRERIEQSDARDGFVLDGFPRTVTQAVALDKMMLDREPLVIVEIAVPEGELLRRLSMRMVCNRCGHTAGANAASGPGGTCEVCGGKLVQRSDDHDNVIRERLMVYDRQTQPLIDFYQARPTFRSVNGSQSPERVAADLLAAIESADGGVTKGVRP